jgi:starch-binding outer membrane protein, SusD/RagB family
MKKITYYALAGLLASAVLSSCNKKLDIDPVNQVASDKALQNSDDVEAALIGAYTAIGSTSLYGGQIQFLSELLGDNGEIQFVGTYSYPKEFASKTIFPINGGVSSTWTEAYRAINSANNVLANISKVTTTKQPRIEGEARFIRATMYFELVKLYAKSYNDGSPAANPGVPLVLTPTTVISAASNVPRNTVAEVYAQIISDLTTAETKIPGTGQPFYSATKYAAAAMLSRVYLQQGNYTDAGAAANRVISASAGTMPIYSLVSSYATEFNTPGNTSEDIFDLQVTSQSGANDLYTFFSESGRGGDVEVQASHFGLYEPGDTRRALFDRSGTYSLKYEGQYTNIKLIRLAEMYLTRAEANYRLGTAVGATPLADVNRVRTRAGLAPLTAIASVDVILKERHLELAFEGFTLSDAKRIKKSIGSIPYNADRLVLPIPQRERDVNPNLTQNPGYN